MFTAASSSLYIINTCDAIDLFVGIFSSIQKTYPNLQTFLINLINIVQNCNKVSNISETLFGYSKSKIHRCCTQSQIL